MKVLFYCKNVRAFRATSAKDLGYAIRTILENYSEFSANTKICYENELEFSKYFKKVLEKVESSF